MKLSLVKRVVTNIDHTFYLQKYGGLWGMVFIFLLMGAILVTGTLVQMIFSDPFDVEDW